MLTPSETTVTHGTLAIVGARGQLGSELQRALSAESVVSFNREQLDVTNPEQVAEVIAASQANVVINCSAYNRVDDAEADPHEAFAVNAFGARHVARACAQIGARFVHVSTDYVFDGAQQTPHNEDAAPRPLSAYGISKLTGEFFAQAECEHVAIIRTAGLYGLAGRKQKGGRGNIVEALLAHAQTGQPLRVVNDQLTAPTYCRDLAEKMAEVIRAGAIGIVHVTNAGQCSWYEFAQAIFELTGLNPQMTAVTTEEFGGRARRPRYSVLANERLRELGLAPMRHWREALADYLEERKVVA